jgi:Uma2 family endonuclease
VPEFWIINLRERCVEIFRNPDRVRRVYADRSVARRGDRIVPLAFPDARVHVAKLLPEA